MSVELGFKPPGSFISSLMSAGFRRHGPVVQSGSLEAHNLDLTGLNLNVTHMTPFLVSKRLSGHKSITAEHLEQARGELEEFTRSHLRKFYVLTVGGQLAADTAHLVEEFGRANLAILDRKDIEDFQGAADGAGRAKVLGMALARSLGREALSPYLSGNPAIGGRFFGRAATVKRILHGTSNCTIIGNRRIGKTSLLKEIQEQLKLRGYRTGEVYGAKCHSTEDVVYHLLHSLVQYQAAERVYSESHRARNLASHIHRIAEVDRTPVAVFIDELDHILMFDEKQNYEVMHLLREAFTHEDCHIFLAGFRKVMEVRQLQNTPPFNFTKWIELHLFSRQEALDMMIKPLANLGIEIEHTDLPGAIYQSTGGHPELIQIQCDEVLQFVGTFGRVPSTSDHLTNVLNNDQYKEKVLGAFLANTNDYEKLLCYLLVQDAARGSSPANYEFGLEDVDRVLEGVGIDFGVREITAICTNIKVSGIISKVAGQFERYRFSAPQLVDYCINSNLEFSIRNTLKRVGDCRDEIVTLWSEPKEADGPGDGAARD